MNIESFIIPRPLAPGEARKAKDALYRAGWIYDRCWFLKETRIPGKTLLIEIRNWREALDWESKMQARQVAK